MSKLMAKVWRYIFESGDAKRIAKQHPDISDLEILKDIAYIDDGERGHLLDIYRRKDGNGSDPVMVNIHGGGLFASYKEVNAHYNYAIAKMGYTVISISYRRIPETTLRHQIDDVMQAFSFIEKNAEAYGIDLNDLYISGDSAGALLSLYGLSLTGCEKLCREFGIRGNGLKFKAASFISIMLETQRKDLMRAISDVVTDENDEGKAYEKYLLDPSKLLEETKIVPIIQFTSDEDLIQKDSLKFCELLEKYHIGHEIHNYRKGKGNKLPHVFSVMYPDYEESKEVYALMDGFFKKHKGE
ncbi:MAG: alpha/beta hydrolase [Erysipelotrichaceae bacterium]|nr:alpha/beta hydrolase [Erysipelotrichaceae bacterium]